MSSEMFEIPIVFNNQEAGKIHHESITISRKGKVGEIINDLNQKFPGSFVSLNNAMSLLQEDDVIEDVYEEEDVLTAVKQKHDIERNVGKYVDNQSGDIVVLMDRNNRPIYVEPSNEQFWEFSLLDLYPRLVVFRKQYEEVGNEKVEKKIEGERVFRGQKYKMPKDNDVHKFKIDREGVYKVTEGGDVVDLPKEDKEVTKLEGVFYRPVGNKLPIIFENLDANSIHVINGGKRLFDPIEVSGGEKKMIDVKADHRASHSFGVATGPVLNNGEREFTATMFDICPGGKEIKISKTSKGFKASLIKAGGVETPLRESSAKVFRESERLDIKNTLSWMFQGFNSLIGRGLNSTAKAYVENFYKNEK